MKTILLAALAATALALPALAGEGNGEPFPLYDHGTTTAARSMHTDTGSNAYPGVAGRPGSGLNLYAAGIVPSTGSEQPVQTANSLPRGFERGMPAYARRLPTRSNDVVENSNYITRS